MSRQDSHFPPLTGCAADESNSERVFFTKGRTPVIMDTAIKKARTKEA